MPRHPRDAIEDFHTTVSIISHFNESFTGQFAKIETSIIESFQRMEQDLEISSVQTLGYMLRRSNDGYELWIAPWLLKGKF